MPTTGGSTSNERQQQQQQQQVERCIVLLSPYESPPRLNIDDAVACQSVEFFEANKTNITVCREIQGQKLAASLYSSVALGQVGLRCAFCSPMNRSISAKSEGSSETHTVPRPDSMRFPENVDSVADHVRTLADTHLANCRAAPDGVRDSCQRAFLRRKDEEQLRRKQQATNFAKREGKGERKDRAALIEYCLLACQQLGVSNRSPPNPRPDPATSQPAVGIEFSALAPANQFENRGDVHTPVGSSPRSLQRMSLPPGYDARMGPLHAQFVFSGASATSPAVDPSSMPHPTVPASRRGSEGALSIAPTPLQRRRDRPDQEDPLSTTVASTPSIAGYPTPSLSAPKGPTRIDHSRKADGAQQDVGQAHNQPNFDEEGNVRNMEGKSSGGHGRDHPTTPQQLPHAQKSMIHYSFDPPSTFPFFQESDRTWHCKFCAHIPPFHRDPQSVWNSLDGGPPPGTFIDHHLTLCSAYQQGYGGPPGSGFGTGPPSFGIYGSQPPSTPFSGGGARYDGHHAPPSHMAYPTGMASSLSFGHPSGYPMMGSLRGQELPPEGLSSPLGATRLGGGEIPGLSDSRIPSVHMGRHEARAVPRGEGRGQNMTVSAENLETMRLSTDYLIQFDKDYYAADRARAAIPKLVLDEDKLLLTDYFFHLMKQLRLCRFSESDRKTRGGKREKILIGFGGLQCIHCSDLPMSRKFFWSNVDRLANSFAEIPGHVLKCRRCPQQTKDALLQLKQRHPEQMAKLPRGSQKVFFRRMWRRLHDGDDEQNELTSHLGDTQGAPPVISEQTEKPPLAISTGLGKDSSPGSKKSSDVSPMSGSNTISSDETILVLQRTAAEAAKVLALSGSESVPPSPSSRVLLAIPEDKEWLSEKDCYIRKQVEVFCATEEDVVAAQIDRKNPISVGYIGLRCLHCSLSKGTDAVGHAIAYPFSISGIYESVRELQRLHLDSCDNLPASTRAKLESLKGASSLSSVLRKYYILAARALGLQDTKEGIRSGGESSPIGSQAAFTFSEEEPTSLVEIIKNKGDPKEDNRKPPPELRSGRGSKRQIPPLSPTRTTLEPPLSKAKKRQDQEGG